MKASTSSHQEIRQIAFGVGYRMLGSRADAEDIAQETLTRVLDPIANGEIERPEAFTTTVATRLALDELKSARRRREQYVGPWLPEPRIDSSPDPVEIADDVSYALLVVLDRLSPLERAAFLLRDVFALDYGDIGDALDRSPVAVRQLVSRARKNVRSQSAAPVHDHDEHRRLVAEFLEAAGGGDIGGIVALLADDAELLHDGGAHKKAARHPIRGSVRIARYLAKVFPRLSADASIRACVVNGEPGFSIDDGDGIRLVGLVHGVERIERIYFVYNPDKLTGT